jgi:uncharacterized protein (TIGR03083 family)
MATWEMAGQVRNDFADMIERLTPEQLDQPSLCSEWTARGVLAHITSFVETGTLRFFATVAGSRFDFDKASQKMANTQLARPVSDVVSSLRAKATKSSALPIFPEELTVADTVIHTQDVRRPLGLDDRPDESVLRTVLDFLTTHKMATTLVNRPSLDGVRLVATDLDWSCGAGNEITGPAEALMMALANRQVLDELDGPGLAAWR